MKKSKHKEMTLTDASDFFDEHDIFEFDDVKEVTDVKFNLQKKEICRAGCGVVQKDTEQGEETAY
ncbi:MAG: hypothetical protein L0956_02975 [Candidatus Mariimomonas ferrooxydans]